MASQQQQQKGRYETLGEDIICTHEIGNISGGNREVKVLKVTVKEYQDPHKSPEEWKKYIWLVQERVHYVKESLKPVDTAVTGTARLSRLSLKKLADLLFQSNNVISASINKCISK